MSANNVDHSTESETETSRPTFSIVIPTHNRPESLVAVLEGITHLDFDPTQFEVVVIDDGSEPSMADHPKLQHGKRPLNCRLLHQENRGPGEARNHGVREARGRWIALIDDDCIPDPNWLNEFEHALTANPQAIIGGYCANGLTDNLYSMASHSLLQYIYDAFNPDPKSCTFFATMNMAFRKDLFEELGGFDARFALAAAEDRDLCDRWRQQIGPLVYHLEAIIHHSHSLNASGFWLQHYKYGFGAPLYRMRKNERRNQNPLPGDKPVRSTRPLTFYWRLITYPLRGRFFCLHAWRQVFLMFVSQVAFVTGCIHGVVHHKFSLESVEER